MRRKLWNIFLGVWLIAALVLSLIIEASNPLELRTIESEENLILDLVQLMPLVTFFCAFTITACFADYAKIGSNVKDLKKIKGTIISYLYIDFLLAFIGIPLVFFGVRQISLIVGYFFLGTAIIILFRTIKMKAKIIPSNVGQE